MDTVLEFEGVERAYIMEAPVLNGVTFSVARGEVVGLVGRNGAGKTTLLRIAMGMLHPQRGSVRVFGLSPTERPVEVKKHIGYVAEDQILPRGSSLGQLIDFYRYLFPQWDSALEKEILERFALDRKRVVMKLSKGEARSVALLCAVCHRPELLILDEPAAGLDPAARREFLEVAVQFLNRGGATILFSSHQMNDLERISGRLVMLDGGKVFLDSETDDLRENYCVAIFAANNGVTAERLMHVPGCVRVRLVFGDWHAVFRATAEETERRLADSLGADAASCTRVNLEDLFVELAGAERGAMRI